MTVGADRFAQTMALVRHRLGEPCTRRLRGDHGVDITPEAGEAAER